MAYTLWHYEKSQADHAVIERGATTGPIYRQLSLLKNKNRGRIREIERAAGLGAGGKISRMIKGKRKMSVESLERILIEAGESPEDFFGQAFGLEQPPPPEPPAVGSGRWLLETLHLDPRHEPPAIQQLREVAENLHGVGSLASPPVASPAIRHFTRERLFAEMLAVSLDQRRDYFHHPYCECTEFVSLAAKVLDDLRYSKPQNAASLAHELALSVCPKLPAAEARDAFASATGVFASARRLAASHEEAARAMALVCDTASPAVRGDLLQRMATLLQSYARYPETLSVNAEALRVFQEEADPHKLGQAHIDRGVALVLVGDLDKARSNFQIGVGLLCPSDHRHHAAARQGFAHVALSQERPEEALDQLAEAEAFITASDLFSRGTMCWFRGVIGRKLGNLAPAETLLRQAQELLWPINVFDWSLVTLDLLSVLLERGKVVAAHEAANHVGRLLEPRKSNRIAAAALQQLSAIQHSAAGLTIAAIETAQSELRRGQCLGLPPCGARPV